MLNELRFGRARASNDMRKETCRSATASLLPMPETNVCGEDRTASEPLTATAP
jgi:hypothetical protein